MKEAKLGVVFNKNSIFVTLGTAMEIRVFPFFVLSLVLLYMPWFFCYHVCVIIFFTSCCYITMCLHLTCANL